MSFGPSGVDSIASNVFAYLYLKKKLNVVSNTAPFIAAAARSPGATNWSYGTIPPPYFTPPTSDPTPIPIEPRNSSGSAKPVRKMPHRRR